MSYLIGVDVGTQSVRACLVDIKGKVLKTSVQEIKIYQPKQDFYEESSEEIWAACCKCSKEIMKNEDVSSVIGIGFTATCSLVALDKNFQPLSVSPSGNANQNVIMWMDHRAVKETNKINDTNHPALTFVGGTISLEMQPPKLLWIKKNLPHIWTQGGYFLDLPDFMTWKATGSLTRSLCSVTCKWMYQSKETDKSGWDETFWEVIDLNDLVENNYEKIGAVINEPGTPCGKGLTKQAAEEMGLKFMTPVGTSIIDAYAGGLGMFSCTTCFEKESNLHSKLGLICGTSSCHLTISKQPVFTPGVWGPYYSVLMPGFWTNEGGQSVTGKLLDHIVFNHPAYPSLISRVGKERVFEELDNILQSQQIKLQSPSVAQLTHSIHIFPDFHGNRSPLADPTLKGMISGLTLNTDEVELALQYLAAIQALAYETRYIISVLETAGHSFSNLLICGGLSKNRIFVQTLADVTDLTVIQPNEKESVLLGAAILGAVASGHFHDIYEVLKCMGSDGKTYTPNTIDKIFHNLKYEVFLKMLEHQQEYKSIMSENVSG